MSKNITLIGSTGLIGKTFLEGITQGDEYQVTAITRRENLILSGKPFIKQRIHDFLDIEELRPDLRTDVLICALGTTIKTAGSQEQFIRTDHDLPLSLAKIAKEEGCKAMILISAVGANSGSKIFYSQVKGELERDLGMLDFEQLHILRPSMLLGDREEKRPGEFVGKLFMKPLNFLIPWKYRAIHVETIAQTIHRLIKTDQTGINIYAGKILFREN